MTAGWARASGQRAGFVHGWKTEKRVPWLERKSERDRRSWGLTEKGEVLGNNGREGLTAGRERARKGQALRVGRRQKENQNLRSRKRREENWEGYNLNNKPEQRIVREQGEPLELLTFTPPAEADLHQESLSTVGSSSPLDPSISLNNVSWFCLWKDHCFACLLFRPFCFMFTKSLFLRLWVKGPVLWLWMMSMW